MFDVTSKSARGTDDRGPMRLPRLALLLALACASACGGDDADADRAVEEGHFSARDPDGSFRAPGSDKVGTLGDGGSRRDGGQDDDDKDAGARDAGAHEPKDAGTREDAGKDSDPDIDCDPISARRDATCDGVDDDCDGVLDEDYVEQACDGRDADLCKDGVLICTGMAGTLCTDDGQSHADVCNGQDDDCDPTSADGSDEPTFGDACDGPDGDLCAEGTFVCDGVALVCSDDSGTTADVCNGQDDDCNPASPDGSGEPTLGDACDGGDPDLCAEGVIACTDSRLGCSDATSGTVELCNGQDDDCNPATPDGSDDPRVGDPCDGPDGDQCAEGHVVCGALGLGCDDATGTIVETCNGDDDDCDGKTDENVDSDPLCSTSTLWGSVSGDNVPQTLTLTGSGETWRTLTIREDQLTGSALYLSAKITLTSAPGTDYDLVVYCERCGGAEAGYSGEEAGFPDVVDVRADDAAGDDTFTVLIEVLYFEASVCANWTLKVESDNLVDTPATCN